MILPFEILFMTLVMLGTIIRGRSIRWFGIWLGMEINLFGLIPIFTVRKRFGEVERSIIYFLIQSVGSA